MGEPKTLPEAVRDWMSTRTRAGVTEVVSYCFEIPGLTPVKVDGPDRHDRMTYYYENDHLHCHCTGCDCTFQMECDHGRSGCQCCHQMCT